MNYGSRNFPPLFVLPPLPAARIANGLERAVGSLILVCVLVAWLCLLTWVPASSANALGALGAFFADALLQSMGFAAPLALLALGWCGIELVSIGHMGRAGARIAVLGLAIIPLAGAAAAVPLGGASALAHGLGGILGEQILDAGSSLFALPGSRAVGAIAGPLVLTSVLCAAAYGIGAGPFDIAGRVSRLRRTLSLFWPPRFLRASLAAENGEISLDPEFDAESQAIARRFAPASTAHANKLRRPSASRRVKPAAGASVARSVECAAAKRQARDALRELSERNGCLLEKALAGFGVAGKIGAGASGPVLTVYEFEPARALDPSRLADLSDGVARVLGFSSARMTPLPGRNTLAIELPNARRETVFLRDLLNARAFRQSQARLPVAIGAAADGTPIVADLARLGHVAIAGAPGSGKSLGLHAIALSLLHRHGPSACQFILIDLKASELCLYEGVPHLAGPVVTNHGQASLALDWAVLEMNRRLLAMAKLDAVSIEAFNARLERARGRGEKLARVVETGFDPVTGHARREREVLPFSPLPYLVILIDGLAELAQDNAKIAAPLAEIARSGPAAGLHLVMARGPSPVSLAAQMAGNVSAHLCYKVSSRRESRAILGQAGAETLLGSGDLLLSLGGGAAMRLQGPFVSRADIMELTDGLRGPPATPANPGRRKEPSGLADAA